MKIKNLGFNLVVLLLIVIVGLKLHYFNRWAQNPHSIVGPATHSSLGFSLCMYIVQAYWKCQRNRQNLQCLSQTGSNVEFCNYQIMSDKKTPSRILTELRRCELFSRAQLLRLQTLHASATDRNRVQLLRTNITYRYLTDGLYCEAIQLLPLDHTDSRPFQEVGSSSTSPANVEFDRSFEDGWIDLGIRSAPSDTIVFMHAADQFAHRMGEHLNVLSGDAFEVVHFSQVYIQTGSKHMFCRSYAQHNSQVECIEHCEKQSHNNQHYQFRYMPEEAMPLEFSQLAIHPQCELQCPPSCVHVHIILQAFARLNTSTESPHLQARYRRLTRADIVLQHETHVSTFEMTLFVLQILAFWLSIGVRCIQRRHQSTSMHRSGLSLSSNQFSPLKSSSSMITPNAIKKHCRVSTMQVGGCEWNRKAAQVRILMQETANQWDKQQMSQRPTAVMAMSTYGQSMHSLKCDWHFKWRNYCTDWIDRIRYRIHQPIHTSKRRNRSRLPRLQAVPLVPKVNSKRCTRIAFHLVAAFLGTVGLWSIYHQWIQTELFLSYKLHTSLRNFKVCACFALLPMLRPNVTLHSIENQKSKLEMVQDKCSTEAECNYHKLTESTKKFSDIIQDIHLGEFTINDIPHNHFYLNDLKCFCMHFNLKARRECPHTLEPIYRLMLASNLSIDRLEHPIDWEKVRSFHHNVSMMRVQQQQQLLIKYCPEPKLALKQLFKQHWPNHKLRINFRIQYQFYWVHYANDKSIDLLWSQHKRPRLLRVQQDLIPSGNRCQKLMHQMRHKLRRQCMIQTLFKEGDRFLHQSWFVYGDLLKMNSNRFASSSNLRLDDVLLKSIRLIRVMNRWNCSRHIIFSLDLFKNINNSRNAHSSIQPNLDDVCRNHILFIQNPNARFKAPFLHIPLRVQTIRLIEKAKISLHQVAIQAMALISILYACGCPTFISLFERIICRTIQRLNPKRIDSNSNAIKSQYLTVKFILKYTLLCLLLCVHFWTEMQRSPYPSSYNYLQPYVDNWTPVFAFCRPHRQEIYNETFFLTQGSVFQHFFKSIKFYGQNQLQIMIESQSAFHRLAIKGYWDCLNVYKMHLHGRFCITLQLGGHSHRLKMVQQTKQVRLRTMKQLQKMERDCNQVASRLQSNLMLEVALNLDELQLFVSSDQYLLDTDNVHHVSSSIEILYEKHRVLRNKVDSMCNNHAPHYEKALIDWIKATESYAIYLSQSKFGKISTSRSDSSNTIIEMVSRINKKKLAFDMNVMRRFDVANRLGDLSNSTLKYKTKSPQRAPEEIYRYVEQKAWDRVVRLRDKRQCTDYYRTVVRRHSPSRGPFVRLIRGQFEWIREQENRLQWMQKVVHGSVLVHFYTELQVLHLVRRWFRFR